VYPSLVADGADPHGYVLEGTRAVLVEFPGWWLEVDDAVGLVAEAARNVERAGLVPILAHPERCRPVAADPGSVRPLAEAGWPLCLNGPSLTGDHGEAAERTAWRLLEDGVVSIVASDAHGFARPPRIDAAFAAVSAKIARDAALPLFDGSAVPWAA
jgi:tyrosine-protein phosphatase YwqE